ncbi:MULTISPECIES: hypothetical protein [unclassified Cryobacterium]|uniref:hypothetical protein n=1 Tax=unclassified Cryobacterium TaxID=2649013 RepID=UPI00106BA5C5|nr:MULTISPECIES: hypothetical protein [unclassified Cryobacterium]TFC54538.1 hypothetical protein E3O68_09350 [Cryobacterium sp. TMB3-1-2]TFC70880.1 hypothetical protein E3T21_09280 [Cryobacterium sp. TMB3-15]TFC77333.1 hypothetical protein E3T22_06400 [Cryobacterium sp. TMB3-10]TFD45267.1 hypothetical protein E3T58_03025 [Cryobacterium sp. TMB3-12]
MSQDRTGRLDRPSEFDPRRSDEIRRLLTGQVAATARPRRARLSRTAFSLAATAALLFAGGIGAGAVEAYDQLSMSADAQNAVQSDSPASAEALSGFSASAIDLVPILIVDGEVGYAHRDALEAANPLAESHLSGSASADSEASTTLVPIYLADGVTLVGSFDPAALIHP